MLALPNVAGKLFNPDTSHPPRQKHLFICRFVRNGEVAARGPSFVVKSSDRPSVDIQTEVINQYNKKKIIQSGIKYNPVNVTFYDTVDGVAQLLWIDYAKYHFADYQQPSSTFGDDIINEELNDPNNKSWGFSIPPMASGSLDRGANSQHYFKAIQIYQLSGGEYISYSLVNPKIASFTPDELSYDVSDISTISMQIHFEAIEHENDGKPKHIYDNEVLLDILNNEFSATYLNVDGKKKVTDYTKGTEIKPSTKPSTAVPVSEPIKVKRNTTTSDEGGVLSSFGTFTFDTPETGSVTTTPQTNLFDEGIY